MTTVVKRAGARTIAASRTPLDALAVRHPVVTPALIGLLGLVISLIGIGVPSIWYDEAATISAATRSWAQLAEMTTNVDAVHALYYAGMHVVFDLFGYSPLTLRIPSAFAVGTAAALTVILGRQLASSRFAVIAGVVFCLLPRTTWMGTEGRSYALSAVFAVLLTVVLLVAVRSPARKWWILYGVVAVISCLMFVYLALVLVAHAASMAWWRADHGRVVGAVVRPWAVASGAATLLVLPFVLAVRSQSGQLHWIDPLGRMTPERVWEDQWFLNNDTFAVAGWIGIAVGSLVLLRGVRRLHQLRSVRGIPTSRSIAPAMMLIPALVLPTAILLTVSELYLPIYTPRYLSMCLPFVALVIAAAIDSLRWRGAIGGVLILLLVLSLPTAARQRQPEAKERSSWAAVAELIASERAADGPQTSTGIVYGGVQNHPDATSRVIAVAYPEAFAGTVDVSLATPAAATGALWETENALPDSLQRLTDLDVVYLVTSFSRDVRPATTVTLRNAGWQVADEWDLTRVHVLRYERG